VPEEAKPYLDLSVRWPHVHVDKCVALHGQSTAVSCPGAAACRVPHGRTCMPAPHGSWSAGRLGAAPLVDPARSADCPQERFIEQVACVQWLMVLGHTKKCFQAHQGLRTFCLIKFRGAAHLGRSLGRQPAAPALLPPRRKHIHHGKWAQFQALDVLGQKDVVLAKSFPPRAVKK
jgi:hypothetical protein